jgi:hypothetical protein
MFGGGAGTGAAPATEGDRPDAEGVFADVFEEVTNFRLDEINPTYSPPAITARGRTTCTLVELPWCRVRVSLMLFDLLKRY